MWATEHTPLGVGAPEGDVRDTYSGCQGGVGEREALQVGYQAGGDDAGGGDGLRRWGSDCGERKGLTELR